MTVLEGYFLLVVFCILVFCVGLYFQRKETRDRMIRKKEAVIDSANPFPYERPERRRGGDRRKHSQTGTAVIERH